MDSESAAKALAADDFNRLRVRETIHHLRSLLTGRGDALLSLTEVKEILRPSDETYRGVQAVPVASIVGSEGRYNDFNRSFLPRGRHMRARWTRVGAARYMDITLPPVRLYEIGRAYFVRDGNHRVSVARAAGVEFIDAEVTSLGTYYAIAPGMTMETLEAAVIEYERQRFNSETGIDDVLRGVEFRFTSAGRYDALLSQIHEQARRLEAARGAPVPLADAIRSWYAELYLPLVSLMQAEGLLRAFPDRTESDLYVWILQHWAELKRSSGKPFPVREAIKDFRRRNRRPLWRWIIALVNGRRPGRRDAPAPTPRTPKGTSGK